MRERCQETKLQRVRLSEISDRMQRLIEDRCLDCPMWRQIKRQVLRELPVLRLASLKLMTGTKSFTNLPHDVTKCYDGDFEACKNSKLRKASLRECGCMPWALKNFTDKVDLKPD